MTVLYSMLLKMKKKKSASKNLTALFKFSLHKNCRNDWDLIARRKCDEVVIDLFYLTVIQLKNSFIGLQKKMKFLDLRIQLRAKKVLTPRDTR